MILILATVIGVFAFLMLTKILWAKTQPKVSTTMIVTVSGLLIGALAILAASGRLHPLMAAGTALLPFLRRGFGLLRFFPLLSNAFRFMNLGVPSWGGQPNFGANSQSSKSETQTSELKMLLDHASGDITGFVLRGEFAQRELASLEDHEIIGLYNALEEDESKRLLESYVARHRPNLNQATQEDSSANIAGGEMTLEKAANILGLELPTSQDEITSAHRRLMQHIHPDKGGSSYLAAEINEAKQVLIDNL